MANVKIKPKTGGDVLIHRESLQYNMESVSLVFPSAGGPHDLEQVAGYPAVVSNGVATLVEAGGTGNGEADCNALLIHGPAMMGVANSFATADDPQTLYSAVTRFSNVVINQDALPTKDVKGGDLTIATIVTALEALGAKVVTEPVKKSTQTT